MNALFKTFASGVGDCIFLQLKDGDSMFNIMVDCGKFTTDIESFVINQCGNHINLLVVTHIDNDHVDGLVEMLEKYSALQIDKILFNCYQNVADEVYSASAEIIQDIEKLTNNLPSRSIKTDGKINMEKASTLASLLLSKDEWKNAWHRTGYIHKGLDPIPLGGNFGRIVLLSPNENALNVLDEEFKREYLRLTHHKIEDEQFEGKEVLFELVSRIVSLKKKEKELKKQHKTAGLIDKYSDEKWDAALAFEPKSVTDENTASIAFVWEFNNHRILFMGDAEPDLIKDSIIEKYGDGNHLFKAIKVSHHGSKHSTSIGLLGVIDSNDYFITGGNKSDKPSIEAIAKIVTRQDEQERTIHYNYPNNPLIQDLRSDELAELRNSYHFIISDNNELEFEY